MAGRDGVKRTSEIQHLHTLFCLWFSLLFPLFLHIFLCLTDTCFKTMGTPFTEMTILEKKSMKTHTWTFPPRRDQIKHKILKGVGKTTETGGFLNSNSTIPTGCNSDVSLGSRPIRLLPERYLFFEAEKMLGVLTKVCGVDEYRKNEEVCLVLRG